MKLKNQNRKRRGNSEGSIYRRADGRWACSVTVSVEGGRQKRVQLYFDSQAEARKKLTDLKKRQDHNQKIDFARQTVREWLEYWLENHVRPNRRPSTWASYDATIRLHVLPEIGGIQLAELHPEVVQSLINGIIASGKNRTAEYTRAILRRAFNQAKKFKRISDNPVRDTEPVAVATKETRVFTAEESERFLQAVKDHPLGAFFWLALALGFRKGELLGLRLEDLDFSGSEIHVRNTVQRLKLPGQETGSLVQGPPKSKASLRDLPMVDFLIPILQAHLDRRRETRELAGTKWQESGHVFCSSIGTPMEPRSIAHALRDVLNAAGLPQLRVHDLRHSCGTFLHARGVSEFTIQRILGHSQLSTTKRYTHTDKAVKKAAVESLKEIFAPAKTQESKPVAAKVAANWGLIQGGRR